MCWSLSCHVTNDSLLLQVAEEQPSYAKRASGSSIPRRHLLCHSRQTTFDYLGTLACVALWLCVTIWWLERSRKPARGPITNAAGRVACSYWLTANIKKKERKKNTSFSSASYWSEWKFQYTAANCGSTCVQSQHRSKLHNCFIASYIFSLHFN